jgi:GGDEF domain-containing protein
MDVSLKLDAPLASALGEALRQRGLSVAPAGAEPGAAPLVLVAPAPAGEAALPGLLDELRRPYRPAPAVVLVAARTPPYAAADALDAGADALWVWEGDAEALAAGIQALVRRRRLDLDRHPLTLLPGGAALLRDLHERMHRHAPVALTGYDVRDFKSYNDRYGFIRGDGVIRFVAGVLQAVARAADVVYHLGGDDFFVVTTPDLCEDLAREALVAFDGGIRAHYDPEDLARGYIVGYSRQSGEECHHPFVSLTAATADNAAADMVHPGQLAQVIAELKSYARRQPGSNHVRDRRRVHEVRESLRRRP